MKKKDVKKFASTKHKGLPEKKMKKNQWNFNIFKRSVGRVMKKKV